MEQAFLPDDAGGNVSSSLSSSGNFYRWGQSLPVFFAREFVNHARNGKIGSGTVRALN
jgi:hypothetical protein